MTAKEVLRALADKMREGKSSDLAYKELRDEVDDTPSRAFNDEAIRELHRIVYETAEGKNVIRAHERPTRWRVVRPSLDEHGIEIGEGSDAGEIQIPSLTDDGELLQILMSYGYVGRNTRPSDVEFGDTGTGFITVRDSESGDQLYLLYQQKGR